MAATDAYALHIYDEDMVKQAVVTDFRSLSYLRRVNWFDSLWFSLNGDHPILTDITDKWFFNLRRRRPDGTWDSEIWAMFRDELWTYGREGSVFSGYCEGVTSFLKWRINNWPSGEASRTKWTNVKGETLLRIMVYYNLAQGATAAGGRKRDGDIRQFTTGADSLQGNTIASHFNFGVNVLQECADMAKQAGGDFKVVYLGSPFWWYFNFYPGQFGDDLSASVTFSMALGNMANPQFKITRSSEKTTAAVWGKGEKLARDYVTRTGDNYIEGDSGTFGQDTEIYVDAKSVDPGDTDGLNARGDAKLEKFKAKETFTFDINQNDGYRYKEDYDLGDLVTAINPFNNTSRTYKIWSVAV